MDMFSRMIEIIDADGAVPDANLHQCLALAEMVRGRHDAAITALEFARLRARTGERAFSCWRYLEVTGRAMLTDLTAMGKVASRTPVPEPEFFEEVRRLID